MILSPSILGADFGILAEQVKEAENAGAQWIHIDVMDGHFVPNISFAMPVIKSLRKYTDMFFDVHIMIENPEKYIPEFAKSGADGITFHAEAAQGRIAECIKLIKDNNCMPAIAINPDTPIDPILPYINDVDMVLCMTVFPGYGGQKYIPEVEDKIRELRKIAGDKLHIQVDGGVSDKNVDSPLAAGADVIVAGSAVFNDDIAGSVKRIMR